MPWLESLAWNEEAFARWMRDLGLGWDVTAEESKAYRQAGFPIPREEWLRLEHNRRKSIVSRIKRILGIAELVVEKSDVITVDVPLFILQAPEPLGSRVTYSQTLAQGEALNWSLRVLGVGFGATQALTLRCKCDFECHAAESSIVFLPTRMRVSERSFSKRGQRYTVVSAEVPKTGAEQHFAHGVKTCDAVAYRPGDTQFPKGRYALKNHKGTGPARYSIAWHSKEDRVVGFEFEALSNKLTMKAAVCLESDIELAFALPGGHDYSLYDLAHPHGIAWVLQ